jgi:hypothetical protein
VARGSKRRWTESQVKEAVARSTSWRQVMIHLGLTPEGGNSYQRVQEVAAALDCSTTHFRGQAWSNGLGHGKNVQLQRAAKKRWYNNNRDVYRHRNIRRRQEIVILIRKLKEQPCSDCGRTFPYFAMDFDHRPGETKLFNIGNMVSSLRSTQAILTEVAKCDLVCCRCHRFRTARRRGWRGI